MDITPLPVPVGLGFAGGVRLGNPEVLDVYSQVYKIKIKAKLPPYFSNSHYCSDYIISTRCLSLFPLLKAEPMLRTNQVSGLGISSICTPKFKK